MIFLKLIAIINIVFLSSFLIKSFNLKNFKNDIRNYFNSITELKNLFTKNSIRYKNKILEKKLNKVSLNGLILLLSLLKIIFPYIIIFYFFILFEFNISIFMISIFALLPYLRLLKK
mgnify:CR=1 FL=1